MDTHGALVAADPRRHGQVLGEPRDVLGEWVTSLVRLERHVTEGFPFPPSGCQIVLDLVAREVVLARVREHVAPRWATLRDELRRFRGDRLAAFLADTGRDLADVLRGRGRSWTALCRDAGTSLLPRRPLRDLPSRPGPPSRSS